MTKNLSPDYYQLDKTVRAQNDFYAYVNNSWLKQHPIPETESRWGTFTVLRDEAWRDLQQLYAELDGKEFPLGSVEQQARDFYYTGMHMDSFAKEHLNIIHNLFAQIDTITTPAMLATFIGSLHATGISGPWYAGVDADDHDSTQHILHLRQSGLILPDRDYYLEDNDKMQAVRAEYQNHVHKVYNYFPEMAPDADTLWQSAFGFEKAIAEISRSSVELRDIEKNYNKTTFAELKQTYGNIDWQAYAQAFGWKADDKLSVDQPEFLAFMNDQFTNRALADWKMYLKWRVTIACYGKVNSELSQVQFEFFGRVLSGAAEIMPLWKRVVLAGDAAIGEAVGRLYVERHFPESSKQQVLTLVEDVRSAYKERIENLDWMSDKTKAYALKKLANLKVLIGYPDIWRDYSGLTIGRDSYLGNILAARRFEVAYWLKRLHEPTSRDDWFMNPQTVNAYHDPNRLVICFPAAILQQPFFDPEAHIAANMGGIGTVIGHELTHGFDDQGCQFDAEGNVRTWQTEAERRTFAKKAQIIIDQADNFEVLPGLNLKGKLVIGESIADLGGIEIAFHALRRKLSDLSVIAGENLTAEQLFYINFARTECCNTREEKLREYTLSDPHPDCKFRVNGMVRHSDDFYRIFSVGHADKLYLPEAQRAKIW